MVRESVQLISDARLISSYTRTNNKHLDACV
jgi:hypothetical protein